MASRNKQPVFTNDIILKTITTDPGVPTTLRPIDNVTELYVCNVGEGCLIERITILPTALVGDTITNKIIYLCLYDSGGSGYNVYKTEIMAGTVVSLDANLSSIEFVFTGGLLMKDQDKIGIAASTNRGATGLEGDSLSITIEGGNYTP